MIEFEDENDSIDISDILNDIIDNIKPLYEKAEAQDEDEVQRFVAALFAATAKLSIELGLEEEDGMMMLEKVWQIAQHHEDMQKPELLN